MNFAQLNFANAHKGKFPFTKVFRIRTPLLNPNPSNTALAASQFLVVRAPLRFGRYLFRVPALFPERVGVVRTSDRAAT
jgi:hypothetical protein